MQKAAGSEMKTRCWITSALAGLWLVLGACTMAEADWRLVGSGALNMGNTQTATAPSLAVYNNTPYVAWQEQEYYDASNFHQSVYVKYFDGSQWLWAGGAALNLSNTQNAEAPGIAISATGIPYVCWRESPTGSPDYWPHVKHFTGSSWIQDGGTITSSSIEWYDNQMAIGLDNGQPRIAGTHSALYVYFFDGSNWSQAGGNIYVTGNQVPAAGPCLAADNGITWIAWSEYLDLALSNARVYVKYFDGSAWQPAGNALNIDANGCASEPVITFVNHVPYVIWTEGSTLNVYVKHYATGTWIQDGSCLNISPGQRGTEPDLAVANGTLYAAWTEVDTTSGRYQIHVKYFNGTDWEQLGASALNMNASQNATLPAIACSASAVYVAWTEVGQIYCKSFSFPTPTPTMTRAVTPGTTPSIATTTTPTPQASSTSTFPPTATSQPAAGNGHPFFQISPEIFHPQKGERARIRINPATPGMVRIKIYSLSGARKVVLWDGFWNEGSQVLEWDGGNCGSGVYIVAGDIDNRRVKGKIVLVR